MHNIEDLIFSANFNNQDLMNVIKSEISVNNARSRLYNAANDRNFTKEVRSCGISWIPVGKDLIIDKVLTDIIFRVNKVKNWNYELSRWQCDIQYTYYYEPQDHYDWHVDSLRGCRPEDQRLISIVYCLSSSEDYEGADLQFDYYGQTRSIKLDIGDFVVFPSYLRHRVTKLISGERETLVGWYQ